MDEVGTVNAARQNGSATLRPWRTHEAARWSGMSERKLLEFAREGVIPARKVGGVWYFSPQKLAEFFGVSL